MSGKAHRARRDASEAEIIEILERRGFKVKPLAAKGLPDLLVWRPDELGQWYSMAGKPYLVECKTGKKGLRETQDWAALGLHVDVLRSAEEAMRWNR